MSLHVSSAPHVHGKDSTRSIMGDVLIALIPATVMGVYCFGLNAALLVVLGIASAAASLSEANATDGMRTLEEVMKLYNELR